MQDKINLSLINNSTRKKNIIRSRKYLEDNFEKEKQRKRDYYHQNKELILEQRKFHNREAVPYKIKYPWMKHLHSAKQRCNNPNNDNYFKYGGRGIQFLLTKEDIEHLWFRDNAELMDYPSIDRIDSNGNYELNNCRFIEFKENSQRNIIKKPVRQLSKDGQFIKNWPSIAQASRELYINYKGIGKCIKNKQKLCGGFKWEII